MVQSKTENSTLSWNAKNSPSMAIWYEDKFHNVRHPHRRSHFATRSTITLYLAYTVYPKKYAHGFDVLCFVVVMQSFIMNSHEVFIHIHQGCFAGTGAIVRLPQCQWSKPDGYGKISQCITTTKHSKAKTVCIFLGIYCSYVVMRCECEHCFISHISFYEALACKNIPAMHTQN